MTDVIHLVYGTDDNYIMPTLVSAASAAKTLGEGRVLVVHLFDAGVSEVHWLDFAARVTAVSPRVTCVRHRLDAALFANFGAWKGSLVTYSRMFMAELLPDLDWAIYFDGDTLWTGDIGKLWALRDETKLVLASIDPPMPLGTVNPEWQWYADRGIMINPDGYLCMGLMLANLKRMRAEGIPQKCRDFMLKYPAPRVVDQTVLNYVCEGGKAPLPKEWGVFSAWHGTADLTRDGAIHYVSDVPWRREKVNRLMSDVVVLWHDFAVGVLKLDLGALQVIRGGRWWRRAVFLLMKHAQPLVKLHPFVHSRFRNTHGLSVAEWAACRARLGMERDHTEAHRLPVSS